jgi:hypothetical protein
MLDQLTSRTAIFFVKGEDQMEKLVASQNSLFPRAKVVAVKELFILKRKCFSLAVIIDVIIIVLGWCLQVCYRICLCGHLANFFW